MENDALPFDKKLTKDDILWAQNKPLSKNSSIAEDFATYESSLSRRPKKPIIEPKLLLKRPTHVSKSKGKAKSDINKNARISHSGTMIF